MPILTILRGISGSGKSTWARSQTDAIVVSRDEIREMNFSMSPEDYYGMPKEELRTCEDLVTEIQRRTIIFALRDGVDVVVDNTHIELEYVQEMEALAREHGANVRIVLVDSPLEVAIKNNRLRAANGGRYVPENVIRRQYERLQLTKDYLPSEGLL